MSRKKKSYSRDVKGRTSKVKDSMGKINRNFQDEAEEQEYQKGLRAGVAKKKFRGNVVNHNANDPQWYFKSNQILQDVASFSFATPTGQRSGMTQIYPNIPSQNSEITNWATTVPGVMSITLGITPGVSIDAQSPMNLAATNVYSYVRYKNSGGRNYDSPDLMLYLLCMDSIYACWNWLKRIYGLASTYSQLNKYMPKAYMAANGVDFDDIIQHLADFRAYLNIKASEISAFCVPATMTYNIRHSWLFSNIYKDSDTEKGQQYIFVPGYFYKYDETSSPKGGQLLPVSVLYNYDADAASPTLFKVSDLEGILNQLLEAVNYSEDIGVMSGDILKAYGEGGLFKLSEFDADYKVEPVFSAEVLSQIENAKFANVETTAISQFNITQDPNTNFIKFQPTLSAGTAEMQTRGQLLNMHHENPSPEEVVVASRLNLITQEIVNTGYRLESCGSEIVIGGWMYVFVENTSPTVAAAGNVPLLLQAVTVHPEVDLDATLPIGQIMLYLLRVMMLESFDWHPIVPLVVTESSGGSVTKYHILGEVCDWDVYTYIPGENMAAINQMALLTEFNVPN